MQEQDTKFRRRGIYLLPNLFTTGALFAGFYAIVAAINGRFELAAVSIFIAMVLDGMDGRVILEWRDVPANRAWPALSRGESFR